MSHVRGASLDPEQDRALAPDLQEPKPARNYFLPSDLEAQIGAFVEHYNHRRYRESLENVTPVDAYFGTAEIILKQRERIKRQSIEHRRLQHRKIAE